MHSWVTTPPAFPFVPPTAYPPVAETKNFVVILDYFSHPPLCIYQQIPLAFPSKYMQNPTPHTFTKSPCLSPRRLLDMAINSWLVSLPPPSTVYSPRIVQWVPILVRVKARVLTVPHKPWRGALPHTHALLLFTLLSLVQPHWSPCFASCSTCSHSRPLHILFFPPRKFFLQLSQFLIFRSVFNVT